jgi:hypothetical protein
MATKEIKEYEQVIDDLEITDDMCVQYALGDYGERIAVYPDGKWAVGESVGNEIDPDERPLLTLSCTGVGNLDRSWFAQGWAHIDDDGNWCRDEGDAMIGDGSAEDMIETCIREGEGFHESLREEIGEAWKLVAGEEKYHRAGC